jgi:hypothetical protein
LRAGPTTPKQVEPKLLRSVDPTDARKSCALGIKASEGEIAYCGSNASFRMFSKIAALQCAAAQPSPDESLAFCILVFEASQDGLGEPHDVCR